MCSQFTCCSEFLVHLFVLLGTTLWVMDFWICVLPCKSRNQYLQLYPRKCFQCLLFGHKDTEGEIERERWCFLPVEMEKIITKREKGQGEDINTTAPCFRRLNPRTLCQGCLPGDLSEELRCPADTWRLPGGSEMALNLCKALWMCISSFGAQLFFPGYKRN